MPVPSRFAKTVSRKGFADAQTDVPLGIPKGAMCVQRLDDSLNSAIHINYRVSLRSSSMREPRDPLLKVLYVIRLRSQTCVYAKFQLKGFLKCHRQADPPHGIGRCCRSNKGVSQEGLLSSPQAVH